MKASTNKNVSINKMISCIIFSAETLSKLATLVQNVIGCHLSNSWHWLTLNQWRLSSPHSLLPLGSCFALLCPGLHIFGIRNILLGQGALNTQRKGGKGKNGEGLIHNHLAFWWHSSRVWLCFCISTWLEKRVQPENKNKYRVWSFWSTKWPHKDAMPESSEIAL